MSRYCFIASDDGSLPEVYEEPIIVGGHIFVENEDEPEDLWIVKTDYDDQYTDVEYYTNLPEIYNLDFGIDKKKIAEFIEYLKKNIKYNKKYEVFQIWLANARNRGTYRTTLKKGLENLHKVTMSIDMISTEEMFRLFREYEYLKIKLYK